MLTKAEEKQIAKRDEHERFSTAIDLAHKAGEEASKDIPDRGACGRGYIKVKATTPFGRWLKAEHGLENSDWGSWHGRGIRIKAGYHGQGYAGERAYAEAFAKTLNDLLQVGAVAELFYD